MGLELGNHGIGEHTHNMGLELGIMGLGSIHTTWNWSLESWDWGAYTQHGIGAWNHGIGEHTHNMELELGIMGLGSIHVHYPHTHHSLFCQFHDEDGRPRYLSQHLVEEGGELLGVAGLANALAATPLRCLDHYWVANVLRHLKTKEKEGLRFGLRVWLA